MHIIVAYLGAEDTNLRVNTGTGHCIEEPEEREVG